MLIYHKVYSHKIWVLTALLLFTHLLLAVYTLVLELINNELNFNPNVLIYHLVYLHQFGIVTLLLFLTQLLPAVNTLVLELINKELVFTVDLLIYRIVYLHKIWALTALLWFTQVLTAVFTLVLVLIDHLNCYELEFEFELTNWVSLQMLLYRRVYGDKIWILTVLLLFTHLLPGVFTLILKLIEEELNLTADVLVYRKLNSIRAEK